MMPRRRNRPRPASTAITTTAAEPPSAVKPKVSFLAAMKDPQLFGRWFDAESWAPWHTVAAALFGESIDPAKIEFLSRHTARRTPPTTAAREAWLVVGRRGGKSLFAAALGVYMSCFRDHRAKLKPGERAVVMVLAADKDQAAVVFGYIVAFFENVLLLRSLVKRRSKESLELTNGVTICVQVASFRRIRGRTVVCAILDECAFWYNDEVSRNPDSEILNALRPSMLTIPDALFIAISSPYAKRGILWDAFERYYGKDEQTRVFVWKADTEAMNPSADRDEIQRAYQEDPAVARAEFGAEFREDLESYVSREALQRVVVAERTALPWEPGVRFFAFVDVAGGSGGDSMALCIVMIKHRKVVVVRLVEWKPPFSPEHAVREAASILAEYRLTKITGDSYAKEWPVERFAAHRITYQAADQVRSDYYDAFLPMINSGRVELLDHRKSLLQLAALERRTARSGKATVGHPPRGHDDLANVIAGACVGVGLVRDSGAIVSVFTRSADGSWYEGGFSVKQNNIARSWRMEDESFIHPHERSEPSGNTMTTRMARERGRRWRAAWGGENAAGS
jgi:hypothetical protein